VGILATEASCYDLLGIDMDASEERISEAYGRAIHRLRELLREGEPVVPGYLDDLRRAYRTLLDPELRKAHDQQLGVESASRQMDAAAPIAENAATVPAAAAGEWRFRFSGDGGEYFRIWIVNLLLSILTLGIYSAWAKVRREQYFHRHLWLADSAFDYHGRPLAILKGRAVAFGLVIVLSVAQKIGPLAYGLVMLGIVPLLPWLAIRALRFRAYNTSYRGLRFSFHGSYGEAFRVFVLYGLFAMVTLWIAFPVWYRRLRQFIFANLRFGTAEFSCAVGVGQIYRAVFGPVLLALGGFIVLAFLLGAMGASGAGKSAAMLGIVLVPLAFVAFQAVIIPWVSSCLLNAVWNSVGLAQNRFRSKLQVGTYISLTLSNWLAIIFTLGLFFPWAQVRIMRYRAEAMSIEAADDLDAFVAGERQSASAIGDQAAEMFDLDIGL
jgi:uncharacterized membrane protein YjgN (DUF898 family)